MPKVKAKYKVDIEGIDGFYVTECFNLIKEGYESSGRGFEPIIIKPINSNRYSMNGIIFKTKEIINNLIELEYSATFIVKKQEFKHPNWLELYLK